MSKEKADEGEPTARVPCNDTGALACACRRYLVHFGSGFVVGRSRSDTRFHRESEAHYSTGCSRTTEYVTDLGSAP